MRNRKVKKEKEGGREGKEWYTYVGKGKEVNNTGVKEEGEPIKEEKEEEEEEEEEEVKKNQVDIPRHVIKFGTNWGQKEKKRERERECVCVWRRKSFKKVRTSREMEKGKTKHRKREKKKIE